MARRRSKPKAYQTLRETLDIIENKLGDDGWLHGTYSTSDPYLMVLAGWLANTEARLEGFPKLSAHSKRVRARPAFHRRVGAFSHRDTVGCGHRSAPVSGRRPRASLNAGSPRNACRSSQPS